MWHKTKPTNHKQPNQTGSHCESSSNFPNNLYKSPALQQRHLINFCKNFKNKGLFVHVTSVVVVQLFSSAPIAQLLHVNFQFEAKRK